MNKKINSIINGWKNYLFEEIKAEDDIIKLRAGKCSLCKNMKNGHFEAVLPDYALEEVKGQFCNLCYCPISTKIRSKHEKCPRGKW